MPTRWLSLLRRTWVVVDVSSRLAMAALYAQHRRRRVARYSRSAIFARWGGTCAYCDAPAEHLDHIQPLADGGADAAHNLLPACADCNLSKGSRTLGAWVTSWGAP